MLLAGNDIVAEVRVFFSLNLTVLLIILIILLC